MCSLVPVVRMDVCRLLLRFTRERAVVAPAFDRAIRPAHAIAPVALRDDPALPLERRGRGRHREGCAPDQGGEPHRALPGCHCACHAHCHISWLPAIQNGCSGSIAPRSAASRRVSGVGEREDGSRPAGDLLLRRLAIGERAVGAPGLARLQVDLARLTADDAARERHARSNDDAAQPDEDRHP